MKTEAIREALAFMRRAGVDGSTGFVLAEAEKELDVLALRKVDEHAVLRDTLATAALMGILSNATTQANGATWAIIGEELGKAMYAIADAALKAREGK